MKQVLTFNFLFRISTLLFIITIAGLSSASAQRSCGTPLAVEQAIRKYPALYKKYESLRQSPVALSQNKSIARGKPVAVIPVVVHVVLPDPNQVTNAQIYSQITVLNQDYELLNPDTANIPATWKPIAGDMKIKFTLAQRTPDGEPTNGIDRVTTHVSSFGIDYEAAEVKHAASGGANAWNTDDYLNIWVCNLSGDNLGVGTPPLLYPKDEQGVVIQYNAFGTVGNLLPDFNKGRSCTHEIGHFFNLLHLWGTGDGSCSPGDYVADTPPQSTPAYGDPAFPDLEDPCSPDSPGIMINNFMGYANDAVMDMFTKGQVTRSHTALYGPRSSLLHSNGAVPVNLKQNDARLRSIHAPDGKLCMNKITPVVTLENYGTKTLTRVSIKYKLDNNTAQTFQWSGNLASLDSIQISLPSSTIATGQHHLQVVATLPNGQTDERPANDTVVSAFHLDQAPDLPFEEGFEGNTFPPYGWSITNPDGQITWQQTDKAADSGSYSAVMNNLDYQANGPVDQLISPVFNIQNKDSAFLFFDVAAAVQSDPEGDNQYWDTLEVLVSFDCGQTGTSVYKKWGAGLITDPQQVLTEFIPNAEEWRRDSIDLTSFINKGPFRIIFRNITNYENNIYLDDINLLTRPVNPILKERKVIVVPNPVSDILRVQFLTPPPDLTGITIYNAAGQLIMQKTATAMNSANRIIFNLANVPNGVYFVKISYTAKDEIVKKIVKIK